LLLYLFSPESDNPCGGIGWDDQGWGGDRRLGLSGHHQRPRPV